MLKWVIPNLEYADPPPLYGQILMKDAQFADTDEKSIFRFMPFFELWLILFTILTDQKNIIIHGWCVRT